VRKACHHAVGVVLRGSTFMKTDSSSTVLHHPAASDVAKFCREEIEKCGSMFVFAQLPVCTHLDQCFGLVLIVVNKENKHNYPKQGMQISLSQPRKKDQSNLNTANF